MVHKQIREQLKQRFDHLCDEYLRLPHDEARRKEILELHGQLAEIAPLRIFLDVPSYECLIAHTNCEALSRVAMNDARLLGNTRVIECSEAEANDLLITAGIHCPTAITRITDAIRIGRSTL